MSDQNQKFNYSYSASQQKEIDKIRKKYLTETEEVNKMEQLRRLDASVTKKATIPALTMGIISTLIMGMGMSLIMTDIGSNLSMSTPLIPGIVIGLIGLIGVISAYPLFIHISKKQRQTIAPQVLKLIDELSQK